MSVYTYDKDLLKGIKGDNVFDIISMIIDMIVGIWFFNEVAEDGYQDHFFFTLLLIGSVIYFLYLIVKLFCRSIIARNIEKEKLEITERGLNMTFYEKVLVSESLKYVEIPWTDVRNAQIIDQNVKNMNLLNALTYKREYKTIRIVTATGLYQLFIENSKKAVDEIVKNTQKPSRNYESRHKEVYGQEENKKTVQPIHKWMCSCGNMISSYPCKYCGFDKK